MKVYVKLIDNTPYIGSKEWCDIVLSEKEWEALDKTALYNVSDDGTRLLSLSSPKEQPTNKSQEVPQPTVMPLEHMLSMGGCGAAEKIEGLWELVTKQNRTKADMILKKEKEITQEYESLLKATL